MSKRNKAPLVTLKKLVRKAKRLGITITPLQDTDARGLFVAYQKGIFSEIPNVDQDMNPSEFIEFIGNVKFIMDVFVGKNADGRPTAVAFVSKNDPAEVQVYWTPWTTVRHKLLLAVLFIGRVGRTRGVMLRAPETSLKFIHNVARRGVLTRVGPAQSTDRSKKFVLYQARNNNTTWLTPLYDD